MNDENTLTALIGLLAEALNAYTENKKLITARLRAEDAQNKWEEENDLLNESTEMCFDWEWQYPWR